MTLCPVALMAGCRKCPAFKVCPLKTTLGDYRPAEKSASGKDGGSRKSG